MISPNKNKTSRRDDYLLYTFIYVKVDSIIIEFTHTQKNIIDNICFVLRCFAENVIDPI